MVDFIADIHLADQTIRVGFSCSHPSLSSRNLPYIILIFEITTKMCVRDIVTCVACLLRPACACDAERMSIRAPAVNMGCFGQRQHILWWDIALDDVHRSDHKPAIVMKCCDLPPDFFADLIRRAEGQYMLGIYAAPERTSRPKSRFSSAGSIPAAEHCTGFSPSMPTSIRSGSAQRTDPQLGIRSWRANTT